MTKRLKEFCTRGVPNPIRVSFSETIVFIQWQSTTRWSVNPIRLVSGGGMGSKAPCKNARLIFWHKLFEPVKIPRIFLRGPKSGPELGGFLGAQPPPKIGKIPLKFCRGGKRSKVAPPQNRLGLP